MNIVRESLLEFDRSKSTNVNKSVIDHLKKGTKYSEIINWISKYVFRRQYKINDDLSIDIVLGDFIAKISGSFNSANGLPEFIKFNNCSGDFIIDGGITDMLGFPELVEGNLGVSDQKLTNLNGCPKIVKGDFHIFGNPTKFSREEIMKICQVGGKIYI